MEKLIIIGGGIAGLVSGYVFSKVDGVQVRLFEPGRLGGEFLAGGLKYVRKTSRTSSMLDDLEVSYSPYIVKGGLLLRGRVLPYPACLRDMPTEQAERIRADHYRKTRKAEPTTWAAKSMNDPHETGSRRALQCDFKHMARALAERVEVIEKTVASIGKDMVTMTDGTCAKFDALISTIPLWILRRMVHFDVPNCVAMKLNIVFVAPRRNPYVRWDYIYTPYTPESTIHRISPCSVGYAAEINGELDMNRAMGDLGFLFQDGFHVDKVRAEMKGHLLPLDTPTDWPENMAPIGRFSEWNPRATMDVCLERAYELAERWFGYVENEG